MLLQSLAGASLHLADLLKNSRYLKGTFAFSPCTNLRWPSLGLDRDLIATAQKIVKKKKTKPQKLKGKTVEKHFS